MLLFLDVVLDARGDDGDDGAEAGFIDEVVHLLQALPGEVMLDVRFLGVFLAEQLRDERVDVVLFDLHVEAQGVVQLLQRRATPRAGLARSEGLEHRLRFAVILLQQDNGVGHRCFLRMGAVIGSLLPRSRGVEPVRSGFLPVHDSGISSPVIRQLPEERDRSVSVTERTARRRESASNDSAASSSAPSGGWVRNSKLGIVCVALFLTFWGAQALTGWHEHNNDHRDHEEQRDLVRRVPHDGTLLGGLDRELGERVPPDGRVRAPDRLPHPEGFTRVEETGRRPRRRRPACPRRRPGRARPGATRRAQARALRELVARSRSSCCSSRRWCCTR